MKHTKGKWYDTFRSNKERGVRNSGGFICVLAKPTHFPNQDERYEKELEEYKANAKLIAAAPELLKALETVFDLIDRGVLVRDISKDHDFKYFTKQGIEIANAIVLVNEAIKKTTE